MRLASFAFLIASSAALTGCIVPELDNYPADKSKGAGTTIYGQDASTTGGGGGGGGGATDNCTGANMYAGSVTFDGNSGPSGYAGQCAIQGNVTVTATATNSEIDQLQNIRIIYGSLVLSPGASVQNLTLPNLTTVQGQIMVGSGALMEQLLMPALKQATQINVIGNQSLHRIDAPAITEPMSSITIQSDQTLQVVVLGVASVNGAVTITDNNSLLDVAMPNLTVVQQINISNNPVLTSIELSAALQVAVGWGFCNDPSLSPDWKAAFKAAHPAGGTTCN